MIPLGVLGSARPNGGPALTLTYRGSSSWSGNLRTFDIGPASPTRQVIVQVSTAESYWSFTLGLQIGGVAAIKDFGYPAPTYASALYRRAITTGTTVEVLEPQNSYGVSFIVWTVDQECLVHDAVTAPTVGGVASAAVNTTAGGFAIATYINDSGTFSAPFTRRSSNAWSTSADAPTDGSATTSVVNGRADRYLYLVSYKAA